jgi:hypothetical protein
MIDAAVGGMSRPHSIGAIDTNHPNNRFAESIEIG